MAEIEVDVNAAKESSDVLEEILLLLMEAVEAEKKADDENYLKEDFNGII